MEINMKNEITIITINAADGGDDAKLFVAELATCYQKYFLKQG